MATVNTSFITNAIPDPEFVTKSFRFILDRGIMGLGSGILKSVDGNQVAVVLPELHDDDYYSNTIGDDGADVVMVKSNIDLSADSDR